MKARRTRLGIGVRIIAIFALLWLVILAIQIIDAGKSGRQQTSDAAIVLGAAIDGDRPSPVFEERIRHGIRLYKANAIKALIFTGGYGEGEAQAEAVVARDYALTEGVPSSAILVETTSRTTYQNLIEARRLMRANGLRSASIVSDPLHIKRAIVMASDLGIEASPAPTPTSRYRGLRTKADFLLHELYFYHVYLIAGQ